MAAGDVSVSFPKVYRVSPNDGTVSGGVTIEDGAMKFNGVDGQIITTYNNWTSKMSFSGWSYRTDRTTNMAYIGSDNQTGFFLRSPMNSNNIGLWLNNNQAVTWTGVAKEATWFHWTVLIDTDTALMELYINGVSQGVKTGLTEKFVLPGFLTISRRGASGDYFKGSQDDILVYTRLLNFTEITQLYNQGRGQYSSVTNGLVAQYSGRDFAGTEAVPTKIYDTKEAGLIRQDTSFIDTAFSEMRVNANSKFFLVKGHKNQVYVTHIEEA